MTVQELYEVLGQAIEQGEGDRDLRMAYQPRYPLQDHVEGIWFNQEEEPGEGFFYIVSGGQDHNSPYAPRIAFEEATEIL